MSSMMSALVCAPSKVFDLLVTPRLLHVYTERLSLKKAYLAGTYL